MLSQVKDKIFGSKGQKKSVSETDIIRLHHNFMLAYGWIPFEEFKSLPLPTLLNLVPLVNEEVKRQLEIHQVITSFAKRK